MIDPKDFKPNSKVGSPEKFREWIVLGEKFEQRFIASLDNTFGNRFMWFKHPNCSTTGKHCKCYDFENLTNEYATIECKQDWYASHSKNLCFERYMMDSKRLKAVYWAHEPWENHVLWFRVDDLREAIQLMIDTGNAMWFMGGDDKRTEMCRIDAKLLLANVKHLRLDLTKPLPPEMFNM